MCYGVNAEMRFRATQIYFYETSHSALLLCMFVPTAKSIQCIKKCWTRFCTKTDDVGLVLQFLNSNELQKN